MGYGYSFLIVCSDKSCVVVFRMCSDSCVIVTVSRLFVLDCGDKLIEVVGMENTLHVAQVYGGIRASGRRLAQCSQVVIRYVPTPSDEWQSVFVRMMICKRCSFECDVRKYSTRSRNKV